VLNVPNYPDIKEVLNEIKKQPKHVAIDADKIAAEIGNKRASNMVMLGAATPFIQIDSGKVEAGIERIFGSKGREVVDLNIQAFRAGMQFALEKR
jgi:indolepyruvate ferredoxin oxidoreductase, beta subunit